MKRKLTETVLTLTLAWGMVMLVALSIGQADLVRTIDMQSILLWTGTLGIVAGFALARSRFPALTAAIYAFVYGAFVLGVLIGRSNAYTEEMLWRERVADMVSRQIEFFIKVANGNTNRDALIFVMHTTVVLWVLGFTSAWWTFRKTRIWHVILPNALVMLSVIYYASPTLSWFLAAFSLVTMLFIAQTHLLDNQREWQMASVRYGNSLAGHFLRSSLVVALVALAVVWRAPALPASASVGDTINRVNEPWRVWRDSWQRWYSALNATAQGTSDPYRETLVLGGARNPGNTLVMDVYTNEELPYAYWRSTTLDFYTDGQWRVRPGETLTYFPEDEPLAIPPATARTEVEQVFVNYVANAGTIYAAPDMVSSDQQILIRADYDVNEDMLFSAARSRYVLQAGDNYVVTSLMSSADQIQLRNAPTTYPADIVAVYLDVPDVITNRTRELASRLTAQYDNPYDKAVAVQNFLRNNITYNDQIEAPPADVEPIDHFLFETQEGYCNYYASAFAMMLRSQGIPTRLSRGFASGEYNADTGAYRVRARDAHTWPEVYFPEYGWIQFEPTVIINPIERPVGDGSDEMAFEDTPPDLGDLIDPSDIEELDPTDFQDGNNVPEDSGVEGSADNGLLSSPNVLQVLGAVFAVAFAGSLIVMANRFNRGVEGTIEGSYSRLDLWSRWLGLQFSPSHTPYERADVLVATVPEGEKPIRRLTNEFTRKQFSRDKKDDFLVNTFSEWRVLRPLLFKKGLRRKFRRDK